jgi:hypothetical protein
MLADSQKQGDGARGGIEAKCYDIELIYESSM